MFNKFIDNIIKRVGIAGEYDPLVLPQKLHSNLMEYLSDNEEIKCIIKNHRAIHNAEKWTDKNTFFNSWCILTNRRLLILRNLQYVKIFREIDFMKIDDYSIEKSDDSIVIKIITSGIQDTIEFSRYLVKHADKFSQKFTDTVKHYRQNYIPAGQRIFTLECPKCTSAVMQEDKFCSNCGSSLA